MRPYLSLVVTSRNDNHGQDLLKRMQLFLDSLSEQIITYELPTELIIVEWNPPTENPKLSESLDWSIAKKARYLKVRIIEVPPEIHASYKHAHQLGLYQMIAKNVGIRRANGEYILATNIDILFADDLIQYIQQRKLDPKCFYRVDRVDVPSDVPSFTSTLERTRWCEANVIRIATRGDTISLEQSQYLKQSQTEKKHPVYQRLLRKLQFVRAKIQKRAVWLKEKIKYRSRRKLISFTLYLFWLLCTPIRYIQKVNAIIKAERRTHFMTSKISGVLGYLKVGYLLIKQRAAIKHLHTNACGDFTLMHKDAWAALKGYVEWDMYSFHIDSIFIHFAYEQGYRQVYLNAPLQIYHMEHSKGSGWTPEGGQVLFDRLKTKNIDCLTDAQYYQWILALWLDPEQLQLKDDWGMQKLELPTHAIG